MPKMIENIFQDIPSELFSKKNKNGIYQPVAENFYHVIIYLIFNLLGIEIEAEVSPLSPQFGGKGGGGRIDAVIEMVEHIYLFEFKRDQSPQAAITQIKARKYPDKYAPPYSPQIGGIKGGKKIHLIGVNFTFEKRGIESWEMESI